MTAAGTIRAIELSADDAVSAVGDNGTWTARQCVVAAGVGSREILQSLGVNVPLAAERGYHLMIPFANGRPTPRILLIGARPEFVITPMQHGVRLAGTVEIARPDAPPNWRRATMLTKLAEQIIEPTDGAAAASMWMGCRPTLPDSLPVIGRIPGLPAVIGAFGHQHLGLTLAAITAEMVGAIARDRPPPLPIAPYSLARF
jgi:D-amino-acid dehydrogenase